jgi:hypothetical protein
VTDDPNVTQPKANVHGNISHYGGNVISFQVQSGVGLYFTTPYEAALYKQQKEKERKEAREQAKRDSLFLTDLSDEEWDFELHRRKDWDPDAA